MVFFADIAKDSNGKPADVLVVEVLMSIVAIPLEIVRLVSRIYAEVVV
jgi:hypothetical protein